MHFLLEKKEKLFMSDIRNTPRPSSENSRIHDQPGSAFQMSKNFDRPDEVRPFVGHGHLEVLNFKNEVVIGRGIFEPGWRWSIDVKPIAGTDSCDAPHSGYCVEGTMVILMDDGNEFKVRSGDAFHIPPGHDAWVEGDKRVVLIDVGGYANYAKPIRH